MLEKYLYKVTDSQSNTQEIEQLKSVILQQSQLLEKLNNDGQGFSKKTANGNSRTRDRSKHSLENQYNSLEKQVYYLNGRLEKLNRRVGFLQQFGVLVILCCAVLGMLLLLATL